ncbi:TIGR03620 family F420-dependent LLM class oxidoreductase [Amycolatopsis sp. H20-H5]|uniref:TIGR03620 family F420-dependent LLM class oxidoreductase n=1 Tax=Amycolatopsis sp. H20-H5 TaxID=3046309 RepID=UPI002DBFBCFD|nr:TIGR03620 family F420-dependent LLM class oxidoreductase [Amycolatopsis sp. H20-H5]MEC3973790.1 TIGR03620 family F420-dependent LLM class oxidoreductase [Amycolatopsis sp. H20-H5]
MSVGIWTFAFEDKEIGVVREAAQEIEELGFDTLWFGEYSGREAMTQAGLLLASTRTLKVATGIARFDRRSPAAAAAAQRTLAEAYPGRFVLGLGGHLPGNRPLETVREYLDGLDAAELTIPVPAQRSPRVIAALGPRLLALAAERADGAHPYFVPVEHTRQAREILGPDAYLAVEQAVVLEPDPELARTIAREHVGTYVRLAPHHRANLRRLGFTDDDLADDDLADGGNDRLVDALVASRGEQSVADRVRAQLDAGADHVCVQVLTAGTEVPLAEWRALAGLVG